MKNVSIKKLGNNILGKYLSNKTLLSSHLNCINILIIYFLFFKLKYWYILLHY